MKEAAAKKREKARADKDVEDVEMKEDEHEQRAPREQDQLTLDGMNITIIIITKTLDGLNMTYHNPNRSRFMP